ncbi:hypothetical protein CBR_g11227 [Chara braunii]|uniref:DDE Tnp4 domain-containing protein n=1 Tax=Chara braunii TaxID=69332 RepID=A0A388KQH5_CHABU|nr:hypothetical protein CBR_g11227 [Chara braunii]|eukprot:GBG72299.1 hypothetical protein CBR_g11227 [Chara braunii]
MHPLAAAAAAAAPAPAPAPAAAADADDDDDGEEEEEEEEEDGNRCFREAVGFGTYEARHRRMGKFAALGFPNCWGCIDCTHVFVEKPKKKSGDDFMGGHRLRLSIVAQLVFDTDLRILHLCYGFPGTVADGRVLRNSSLWRRAVSGELFTPDPEDPMMHLRPEIPGVPGGYLLADIGYPTSAWLVVSFGHNHVELRTKIFDSQHKVVRPLVERGIGLFKMQFQYFYRPHVCDLKIEGDEFHAACIVHNLLQDWGDLLEEYVQPSDFGSSTQPPPSRAIASELRAVRHLRTREPGVQVREALCRHVNAWVARRAFRHNISQSMTWKMPIALAETSMPHFCSGDLHQGLDERSAGAFARGDLRQTKVDHGDALQWLPSRIFVSNSTLLAEISTSDFYCAEISARNFYRAEISARNFDHAEISARNFDHAEISARNFDHTEISSRDLARRDLRGHFARRDLFARGYLYVFFSSVEISTSHFDRRDLRRGTLYAEICASDLRQQLCSPRSPPATFPMEISAGDLRRFAAVLSLVEIPPSNFYCGDLRRETRIVEISTSDPSPSSFSRGLLQQCFRPQRSPPFSVMTSTSEITCANKLLILQYFKRKRT